MNKTLSLLFYLKRSKVNKKGLAPLYLRITVDGVRCEISSKRYINPAVWNGNRQKLNGTGEESRNINAQLKSMELHIYEVYREMIEQNIPLTMSHLKCILNDNGEPSNKKMLIPIFEEHNERIKSLVGKEYASGTYQRYVTSLKHTIDFLQWKYKVNDIGIESIDHEFITSYDYYLRSERNCNNNSTRCGCYSHTPYLLLL
ncbi:phage integrase SAM-like domain and Arm DNA-binding domain-containing protein [Pelobium sp.]|nr:phage integrase SAM-like domain-containing protein [Pelobium sp.]MDA9555396.1 phage integrase SAM-like domain and Arm DNA-binding domain-containing protein [Pelobium sp.]